MKKGDHIAEARLIIGLKNGELFAFNHLFDVYAKRLLAFSMGYLSSDIEAEEIVQEVFIKIWNNRDKLSPEKSFESYLFTIAKNGILNTIRKSKSENSYRDYVRLYPEKDVLVDEEFDFKELESIYLQSVEKLSPRRKEIFLLSREQSLSNAQIAAKMNISVKTVENQMTAALSQIRKHLSHFGFIGLFFYELFL